PPLSKSPTAQQSLAVRQRTALSSLTSPAAVPPWLGTFTWDQLLPVQCRTWFRVAPAAVSNRPTAQQLSAEVQNTSLSWLRVPGIGTARPPCARAVAGVPAETVAAISAAPSNAGTQRPSFLTTFTARSGADGRYRFGR